MSDRIRKLLNRVLDYVISHPTAEFHIWQWDSKMYDKIKRSSPRLAISFWFRGIIGVPKVYYVEHDGDPYWSGQLDCTEENLEILLKKLEKINNG